MILTKKQTKALDLLEDHTNGITEVLYGGGAGGGKSALGCYNIAKSALRYPGTRWLLGREELKNLKETTLITFWDIVKMQQVRHKFHYREQQSSIEVDNGSIILLKGLPYEPSDKDYDYLGSLEITGGFIDEIPQIRQKAWQVVKSRIRYKLDEFGLSPKLMGSCNPSKGWTYNYFYKPSRQGTLEPYKAFVQSLLSDNPHVSKHYLASLMTLDVESRQRLLLGNWDYIDDPTALMEYDAISSVFTSQHIAPSPTRYLTGDIARLGKDKTVLMVWYGWRCVACVELSKSLTTETASAIRRLCQQHQIPMSNCVVDEDGVGGGVRDQLPGCKGFVNNSRAIKLKGETQNYENLKTQCYYRLAEQRVNKKALYFAPGVLTSGQAEKLTEELGQVKSRDADKDGVLRIQPKEMVKLALGRSPDYSDTLMMREYFELASTYRGLL